MRSAFQHIVPRLAAALALAGLVGAAQAATIGTPAGTTINNMASIDYSIGGVPQTTLKSCALAACTSATGTSTSFVVDNKVDVLVTIPNTTYVNGVPGATVANAKAVALFTVTNNGNKTQDFHLDVQYDYSGAVTIAGFGTPGVTDTFNPTACSAYVPSDGNKAYIDELKSGDSVVVAVACAIPLAQLRADIAAIALKATVRAGGAPGTEGATLSETTGAGTAGEDIVFADAAGVFTTGGADVARDGAHSALNAFKVITAVLETRKDVATLCDPLNGATNPKNIPGAFVRYTITISNAGTDPDDQDATLDRIIDQLNANLTFDADLIKGQTAAECKAASTQTESGTTGKGVSFKVSGSTRTGNNTTSYKTVDATGVTDGAGYASSTLTLDFAKLLPVDGSYTAGLLKKGESVTVIFNAQVN